MVTAKILGTGCPKCNALEAQVRDVASRHDLDVEVIKVSNIDEIIGYNIMVTPALVVQEEVKSVGVIPKEEEILAWLTV
ncbi:thioredoxin family protein [Candidatus Neomarinimicrobiota bacterium]